MPPLTHLARALVEAVAGPGSGGTVTVATETGEEVTVLVTAPDAIPAAKGLRRFTDVEARVVAAMEGDPRAWVHGATLARLAGQTFSTGFQIVLSNLVKRGVVQSSTRGYRLAQQPPAATPAPPEAPEPPQDATEAPAGPQAAGPVIPAPEPPEATPPAAPTLDVQALAFLREKAATPLPWATAKEVAQALGLPRELPRVRVVLADLTGRGLLTQGPGGWRLAEQPAP